MLLRVEQVVVMDTRLQYDTTSKMQYDSYQNQTVISGTFFQPISVIFGPCLHLEKENY